MRLAAALLPLAAAALMGPAAPKPAPKVDLFGYYYLHEEEAPKGFQDIDHLHLSTIDMKGTRWWRSRSTAGSG